MKSRAVVFHRRHADPAAVTAVRRADPEGDPAVDAAGGPLDLRGVVLPALRVLRIWRRGSCSPVAAPTPEEKASRDLNLTVYSFKCAAMSAQNGVAHSRMQVPLGRFGIRPFTRADADPDFSIAFPAWRASGASCYQEISRQPFPRGLLAPDRDDW